MALRLLRKVKVYSGQRYSRNKTACTILSSFKWIKRQTFVTISFRVNAYVNRCEIPCIYSGVSLYFWIVDVDLLCYICLILCFTKGASYEDFPRSVIYVYVLFYLCVPVCLFFLHFHLFFQYILVGTFSLPSLLYSNNQV